MVQGWYGGGRMCWLGTRTAQTFAAVVIAEQLVGQPQTKCLETLVAIWHGNGCE